MFNRVLVPTDFSPSGDYALHVARQAFPDALRRIVHVVDARAVAVPDLTTGGVTPVPPSAELQREFARVDDARLDAVMLAGEERELLSGDPVRAILQSAQAWSADLIVLGTHGRHGLERFLLGSVAERVVRDSPIPVLTVHAPHQPR